MFDPVSQQGKDISGLFILVLLIGAVVFLLVLGLLVYSIFRFRVAAAGEHRSRLRFWQEYAVELADDYYGVYNFNWGYYLESLRLLCVTDTGKPYQPQRTGT